MTNFIYRRKNAFSKSLCRSFIETFEIDKERQKPGVVRKGDIVKTHPETKISTDISFIPTDLEDPKWNFLLTSLIGVLHLGKSDYTQQFYRGIEALNPFDIHHSFNMQRYNPGEGYTEYHCERAGYGSRRMLVWMLYLNDVNDRGWTEFYYQQHYEAAEEGKLVIWPSDFTHTHRGIVSNTETKYVLTGWYTFTELKDEKS